MSIQNPSTTELGRILREVRTVAVVGASDNRARPSNDVFGYLARSSHFELYPVNPGVNEVEGITAYPRLADLPVAVDMVDVFRRYDDLAGVLHETLELTPRPKYLWLQQGLWHDEVGEAARAAGLTVIMDRCLKVDYALLVNGS
jgi:predicted CoA-binding protein